MVDALREAQVLGFLGARPVEEMIEQALAFAGPVNGQSRVLDMGSGGGMPGLVIAAALPAMAVVLLDASGRRTDWLRRVVGRLGWEGRVVVVTGRAEVLGHEPVWRERMPAVVARGFGPPLVTAECAAGLLEVGGVLVVSEPPPSDDRSRQPSPDAPRDASGTGEPRWSPEPLADLGLRLDAWPDARVAVIRKIRSTPDMVPRARILRRK